MRSCGVIAAIAGTSLLGIARAQNTWITNEVSTDGGVTWLPSASVLPGATLQVRLRLSLHGAHALGLAGITFQPTLNGWRADLGDMRQAFTFPGLENNATLPTYGQVVTESAYTGRHVADVPGTTGRIFPFGGFGQNSGSPSGLLTSFADPGNVLRFAGSKNTTAQTNTAWGAVIGQVTQSMGGTYFNTSLDVVVFKYAVTLSTDPTPRSLSATIPLNYISGGTVNVPWYMDASGLAVTRYAVTSSTIVSAGITVVPSPAGLWVMATTLACAARRRRSP